jgi:hypothetical protein
MVAVGQELTGLQNEQTDRNEQNACDTLGHDLASMGKIGLVYGNKKNLSLGNGAWRGFLKIP